MQLMWHFLCATPLAMMNTELFFFFFLSGLP
jgi:hypothetical protein